MIYDLLASIYDGVNGDIDYVKWADFIERIISEKYTPGRPELVLDLACGTGRMTVELARRGYDMTGVDYSVEMLERARESALRSGVEDILWLNQDMREFELYGTVDVTVSCLDSINHLVTPSDLRKCFNLVHNYLIPDGLFIFDINGKGKFERVYANETYVMEVDDRFCVWQNSYDANSKVCDFYITLFSERENGSYDRYDEYQRERMYTLRAIKKHLADTGFEFVGAYSDYDFTAATDDDERIYVVARCIKR